jgi:hypothetical protein
MQVITMICTRITSLLWNMAKESPLIKTLAQTPTLLNLLLKDPTSAEISNSLHVLDKVLPTSAHILLLNRLQGH